ncbi:TetR/AcrR family transcriptional regulator [Undibacterium arcticum]|uniref:TetR/AcrR family transcriptional regulator n=1 Tax=Undibacterium arcticum TaxID=1762892 RepID=A0ABV7F6U1_9BURK
MARPRGIERREQLKEQIIQGAVDALVESGLAAVTTRKIAAKAGVNLATLHYYFENKDALLIGALESIIAQMSQALRADLTQQLDIKTCIESVISNSWRLIQMTRNIQILQYELTLYTLRNEDAQSLAKFQYDSYCKLYEDAFRQGLGNAEAPPAIDLADLARFVVAGMDGLILQYLVDPVEERSTRALKQLIKAAQGLCCMDNQKTS